MKPWILLAIAGVLEVVWATGLKKSDGFSKLWPTIVTVVAMLASFYLLAAAMKSLPMGVSYTVWVGIGAVGSIVVGALWLGERISPAQGVCLALIVVGIVGLKLTSSPLPPPKQPASAQPV